jgi:phage baseplate assembly protein W
MAEVALSLPFSIDPYGRVGSTQDQTKIWADKVRSVIGTALRERVMRPKFGTDIPLAVFENQEDAQTQIEFEVNQAFNEQLQKLTLQSVDSVFDEYTGIMQVEVIYALPNDEVTSTSIGLIRIQGNAIAIEENL